MTHCHFRSCLRFSFAELKKPAIYIFFRNLYLLSFPMIYSLPCFPLKRRAHEFFPRGHPRRSGVTLKHMPSSVIDFCLSEPLTRANKKVISSVLRNKVVIEMAKYSIFKGELLNQSFHDLLSITALLRCKQKFRDF